MLLLYLFAYVALLKKNKSLTNRAISRIPHPLAMCIIYSLLC